MAERVNEGDHRLSLASSSSVSSFFSCRDSEEGHREARSVDDNDDRGLDRFYSCSDGNSALPKDQKAPRALSRASKMSLRRFSTGDFIGLRREIQVRSGRLSPKAGSRGRLSSPKRKQALSIDEMSQEQKAFVEELAMWKELNSSQESSEEAYLADVLSDMYLNVLNISGRPLVNDAISFIERFVSLNANLSSLNLSRTGLASAGASRIFDSLSQANGVRKLKLFGNKSLFRQIYAANSAKSMLLNSKCLTTLFLGRTGVGNTGVLQVLADSLRQNTTLKTLGLTANGINSSSIAALFAALCDNDETALEVLLLSENKIDNAGADALGQFLSRPNCRLKFVDFGKNKVGNLGIAALFHSLVKSENKSLKEINFICNKVGNQGVVQLCKHLKEGRCSMENIGLVGNKISDQATEAICNVIMHTKSLKELRLSCNRFGESSKTKLRNAAARANESRSDDAKLYVDVDV